MRACVRACVRARVCVRAHVSVIVSALFVSSCFVDHFFFYLFCGRLLIPSPRTEATNKLSALALGSASAPARHTERCTRTHINIPSFVSRDGVLSHGRVLYLIYRGAACALAFCFRAWCETALAAAESTLARTDSVSQRRHQALRRTSYRQVNA